MEYLCDSGTEYEGLKMWGSPYTKKFTGQNPKAMAFCLDTEEELEEKWKLIPDDTDILITHGPPYGILDKVERDYTFPRESISDELYKYSLHVGCPNLREHVIGRIKPKLHIFSHIHECGGKQLDAVTTRFINCSIMNEKYRPVNKPMRIEL
jgi:Icc-related predicted phosphoesterase